MQQPTQYPYSINYSLASILVMLILLWLLFSNVANANTTVIWVVFGIFSIAFAVLMVLLIVKRVIPALKGKTALELNDEVLIDYIRNITINWPDIKEISMVRGRSSAIMRIDLKWESDYGSEIAIPLRWIKGKDDDIYNTVMAYYEQGSGDIIL
jgi:hypothetical protein